MYLLMSCLVAFLLLPHSAFAWGPLTHVNIGSDILSYASLIPPTVYALISKYKSDFIYGNIMADTVIAKKHIPFERHPHNWDVAKGLYDSSETDHERAFSLGYLCHLAADTVAHGDYTSERAGLGHAFVEFRADSFVHPSFYDKAMNFDKKVSSRNDKFLKHRLDTAMFSFETNRRLFMGSVAFAGIAKTGRAIKDKIYYGDSLRLFGTREDIESMRNDSMWRAIDVLRHHCQSDAFTYDPIGTLKPGKLMKFIIGKL